MTPMQRRLLEIQSILNSLLHRKDTSGGKPTMVLYKVDEETGDTFIGTPFEEVYALAIGGYPVFVVDVSGGLTYQLVQISTASELLEFYCANGGTFQIYQNSAEYDPDLHL